MLAMIFGSAVAAIVEGCDVASTFAGSSGGVRGGGLKTLSFVSGARGKFCGENVDNAAASFATSARVVAAPRAVDGIAARVDESSIGVWTCGALFEMLAAALADCEDGAAPSGTDGLSTKETGVAAN